MAAKSLLQREIKKHVIAQLESSLLALKDLLGEEKFSKRIKKATKLLVEGIGKEKKEAIAEIENEAKEKVVPAPVKRAVKKNVPQKKSAPVAKKAVKKAAVPKKVIVKGK